MVEAGEPVGPASGHLWAPPDLGGRVALVTGASRGVGRGVAAALGECSATVYVTGRSRAGAATEGLLGSVDETAQAVGERGGLGVAVHCDHADAEDIGRLVREIERDAGRVDLLVNNAWSGYQRFGEARFDAPFWEQPAWRYDLFEASLRGYYLTAAAVAPLMIARRAGLIINIGFRDGDVYLGQVAYDMVKAASDRMAFGMAQELARHDVQVVSLHPGFVTTERLAAAASVLGAGPSQVLHTPEYVGRAVAMLLADPDREQLSGHAWAVGDLAVRYDFTDVDGRQPPAFRLEGRMSLATRMERLTRLAQRALR